MINNEVKYYAGDLELINGAAVNENGGYRAYHSPTYSEDISGAGVVNYATLEAFGFRIDDAFVFADDTDNLGYLSERQTNANSVSAAGRTAMEVTTEDPCTSGGITIQFFQNPCVNFDIQFWGEGGSVGYVEVRSNSDMEVFIPCAAPFTTVTITFLRSVYPNSFFKIRTITYGRIYSLTKFFGGINIFEEIAPDCGDIPAATCDFEALLEDQFTPEKGQPVEVYHNSELLGRFFVDEAEKVSPDRFTFACCDSTYLLDSTPFTALEQGLHSSADIISEIEENANTNIEGNESYDLFGFIEPQSTCRAALAMVAFAQQKIVTTERSSAIRMIDPPSSVSSFIGSDRILGKAIYKEKAPYTRLGWYIYENSFDGENLMTVLFARNPMAGRSQPNQKSFSQYSLAKPDSGGGTFQEIFAK